MNDWKAFTDEYCAPALREFSTPERIVTLADGASLLLRMEREEDYRAVENMTRRAFWGEWPDRFETLGGVGCNEHYLCHILRSLPEFIPALDLVALIDGEYAGNIMYSLGCLEKDGAQKPALIFGPLTVDPAYQKRGVGGELLKYSIERAKELGFGAIFLYGHPSYYPRHGFADAKKVGATTPDGQNFPAFMAMELIPGYIDGGAFYESPAFDVDALETIEFDKTFPPFEGVSAYE